MEFIKGRNNLACTIFVPYNCDNNCPFCTTKKLYYNNRVKMNLSKIIREIELLNYSDFFSEYVISGGEPFNNIFKLKMIIDTIKKSNKDIYINTTLPNKNLVEIIDYINNEPAIKGINISRHIGYELNNVASVEEINHIKKPIRINTVINKDLDFDDFLWIVENYKGNNRVINLRANYQEINNGSLKNRDSVCNFLLDIAENIGNSGCMVCNSNLFNYKGTIVNYHRGLSDSSFKINNKLFVNDIVIRPDGLIMYDWQVLCGQLKIENREFNKFLKESCMKKLKMNYYICVTQKNDYYYYNKEENLLVSNKDEATKFSTKQEADNLYKEIKPRLEIYDSSFVKGETIDDYYIKIKVDKPEPIKIKNDNTKNKITEAKNHLLKQEEDYREDRSSFYSNFSSSCGVASSC